MKQVIGNYYHYYVEEKGGVAEAYLEPSRTSTMVLFCENS